MPAHIILTLPILNGFVHITKTPHKSFITQEYRNNFQMCISLIELSGKWYLLLDMLMAYIIFYTECYIEVRFFPGRSLPTL